MERQHKKRLTQEQIRLLESSFNFNDKLDPDRKIQLAQELGLPPRKISVWYQNKRARWKAESLEVDYKGLKQKLDEALAHNQRLQAQVRRLEQELHKAQEMVSINSCLSMSHLSSSCDEVGSSNLDKVDMFACLLGGGQAQFGTTPPPNDHDFFPSSIS